MNQEWSLVAFFPAVAVASLALGCSESAGGGSGSGTGGGSVSSDRPSGAEACYERYFSKVSQECVPGDCGEAMTCTSDFDCIACSDRCETNGCGSDADCEEAYGSLCDDVEWRCQSYITADDLRCAVFEPGAARCGDGACADDETCSDCAGDCGYCPGEAPAMAACSSDEECASGWCLGWCVISCSSGWDCVGDGSGTLYGECVGADIGGSYCFPSCSFDADCAPYPGTICGAVTVVDGWESHVCTLP